jgi:hypothetical protein
MEPLRLANLNSMVGRARMKNILQFWRIGCRIFCSGAQELIVNMTWDARGRLSGEERMMYLSGVSISLSTDECPPSCFWPILQPLVGFKFSRMKECYRLLIGDLDFNAKPVDLGERIALSVLKAGRICCSLSQISAQASHCISSCSTTHFPFFRTTV